MEIADEFFCDEKLDLSPRGDFEIFESISTSKAELQYSWNDTEYILFLSGFDAAEMQQTK